MNTKNLKKSIVTAKDLVKDVNTTSFRKQFMHATRMKFARPLQTLNATLKGNLWSAMVSKKYRMSPVVRVLAFTEKSKVLHNGNAMN